MRLLAKISVLVIAAATFSLPLSIAVDLTLYDALADHLGTQSLTAVADYLDRTEMARAFGFFCILMLWSGVVLAIDNVLKGFRRKAQIIVENVD